MSVANAKSGKYNQGFLCQECFITVCLPFYFYVNQCSLVLLLSCTKFWLLTSAECFLQRIFISQWHINGTKLWKPVSDFEVSNDTLTINTTNLFRCFCCMFLILKLSWHYMSNMLFQLLYFWAWDHKLNYDVHSFTTEIRRTDEDTL